MLKHQWKDLCIDDYLCICRNNLMIIIMMKHNYACLQKKNIWSRACLSLFLQFCLITNTCASAEIIWWIIIMPVCQKKKYWKMLLLMSFYFYCVVITIAVQFLVHRNQQDLAWRLFSPVFWTVLYWPVPPPSRRPSSFPTNTSFVPPVTSRCENTLGNAHINFTDLQL